MFEAVLFDLDGTLADTAPDLGGATNILLLEEGRPQHSLETLRPYVSQGVRGLLALGAGIGEARRLEMALDVVADRIAGLELGADDYVPKPCTPRELAARVRAILKRTGRP